MDFDLRKSSLHDVFNTPRSPGVSEFLRGESEFERIVRPTDSQHLSLLTAGAPFTNSLGTLSNGVTRSLFDQARQNFEFVVVDGSPILPVVDALLTSQHVDTVVLSVRRDVSEAPRIRAACEQLSAFGVEECVAVLAGSDDGFDYYGDHEPGGTVPRGADQRTAIGMSSPGCLTSRRWNRCGQAVGGRDSTEPAAHG